MITIDSINELVAIATTIEEWFTSWEIGEMSDTAQGKHMSATEYALADQLRTALGHIYQEDKKDSILNLPKGLIKGPENLEGLFQIMDEQVCKATQIKTEQLENTEVVLIYAAVNLALYLEGVRIRYIPKDTLVNDNLKQLVSNCVNAIRATEQGRYILSSKAKQGNSVFED